MHTKIIEAIHALRLDRDAGSYCRGIALLSAQAWLAGGEHKLHERLELLRKLVTSGRLRLMMRFAKLHLRKKKHSGRDLKLMDLRAWLEALPLAQYPGNYPELFPADRRPKIQRDIDEMLKLVASREIEAASGMHLIKSWSGFYLDEDELAHYFVSLVRHVQGYLPDFKGRISFTLQSYNHSIMFGFDFNDDSCNFNCGKEMKTPRDLAKLVIDKFERITDAVFATEVYVTGADRTQVAAAMDSYCESQEFRSLHAVAGAKIDGDHGLAWLRVAAQNGQMQQAAALLAQQVVPDGGDVATPFMLAVENGEVGVMSQLLAAGANINQMDDGETALMSAAKSGFDKAVCFLLGSGVDPGIVNNDGKTASDLARENGFDELADYIQTISAYRLQLKNECVIC